MISTLKGSHIISVAIYKSLCLDIFLEIDNQKLDIEYDSWYWHIPKKDRKRDEFLKSKGFKILRIKSGKKIPTKELLFKKITNLLLSKNKYSNLILEDWNAEGYAEEGRNI